MRLLLILMFVLFVIAVAGTQPKLAAQSFLEALLRPLGLSLSPDEDGLFRTDTPRSPYPTIRFASIGDYGNDSQPENDVADLVKSWNPDFVITLGDNRYGSRSYDTVVGKYYCVFLKDALSGTFCPSGGTAAANAFFPSTGNHEYSDGGGINEYLDYFKLPGTGIQTTNTSGSEHYYDFIIGPVHFFAIDSTGVLNNISTNEQKTWLETQLKASTTPWQLVFFHHPPYSSGLHGSNTFMQWDFAAWGADALMAGHDHTYERLRVDGLLQFVNGAGGNSLYPFPIPPLPDKTEFRYADDWGAMLMTADDVHIKFEFYNRFGTLIDSTNLFNGPVKVFVPLVLQK